MEPRIEALAEAWASMDGELDSFYRCKEDGELDKKMGTYVGYLSDAEELHRRLQKRGYEITQTR